MLRLRKYGLPPIGGSISSPCSKYVEVSLGKKWNPKLVPMALLTSFEFVKKELGAVVAKELELSSPIRKSVV